MRRTFALGWARTRRPWTLFSSRHLSPPPPSQCPHSNCMEGRRKGRFSTFHPDLRPWDVTGIYLETSGGDGDGTERAPRQCLLTASSSFQHSPTAITETPSTTVFSAARCICFTEAKRRVFRGAGSTQSGFGAPNFSRRFLRPLPFRKLFSTCKKKYLYRYYLLVSRYSSFGCKL